MHAVQCCKAEGKFIQFICRAACRAAVKAGLGQQPYKQGDSFAAPPGVKGF